MHVKRAQKIKPVRPNVICPSCDGKGNVPLGDEMWNTLEAVRVLGESTTDQIAMQLKWDGSPTAINNRLTYLYNHLLLSRKKVGREWLYRIP